MSDSKRVIYQDGYSPDKKGWQPQKEPPTSGHKPEKSELAPTNPPKKR